MDMSLSELRELVMDREVWRAAIHVVAKSWTRLSKHMHALIFYVFIMYICLYAAAAAAKSLQLCPTQSDPIDVSPPGSFIPGILQARTLEWLPFPSPMHESEK